jgi:Zn-dependent M28 family amino/carboxypeptidase
MDCSLSFHGDFRQREFLADNLVGLIRGHDSQLDETYLIISAHYDHLGVGPESDGDRIYNGAFDNALGVAVMLELASAWVKNPTRRSVLFIATTGEEKGLLGSYYYARHPLVPLYRTIAAVNIDGIAVFDRFKSAVGIGAEYSELGEVFAEVAVKKDLVPSSLSPFIDHSQAFTHSDQLAFAEAGIPSILLIEGLDFEKKTFNEALEIVNRWGSEIYHSPFDDADQSVNWSAVLQHYDLLEAFCRAVGDIEEEPDWYDGTPFIHARLQSKAQRR